MRSEQILKGHVTDVMSISLPFSRFILKLHCFYVCFSYFSHFLILISLFLHFVILLSIRYLRDINWEVLPLAKFVKPHLSQNF